MVTNICLKNISVWRGRNRGVNLPSFWANFSLLPTFWANFSLLPKRLPHIFSLLPTFPPYFSLLPTFFGPFHPPTYSVPPPSAWKKPLMFFLFLKCCFRFRRMRLKWLKQKNLTESDKLRNSQVHLDDWFHRVLPYRWINVSAHLASELHRHFHRTPRAALAKSCHPWVYFSYLIKWKLTVHLLGAMGSRTCCLWCRNDVIGSISEHSHTAIDHLSAAQTSKIVLFISAVSLQCFLVQGKLVISRDIGDTTC